MKIIVYTSVTNSKDPEIKQDYEVKVFKDAYNKFTDSRRNSRIHKIMPHKYLDCDVSIYIDGNMKLLAPPELIVEKYLGKYDMALFKHGARDCIYDEAIEVAKLGLDDVETIIEQAKYYEDNGYPKHNGLLQGGVIIRRHNEKTERFNELWWADYCRFSRRDQLSLMPAIEKSGVSVNRINDKWSIIGYTAFIGGIIEMFNHSNLEGNFNEQK